MSDHPDGDGAHHEGASISYVILCHSGADQVLRLARTIRALSPRARVLIRHNQPPGFLDDSDAQDSGADLLVSTIHCRWGHWSLVEATVEAFRQACRLHDPAWVVLISGQDYPIRPLDVWESMLLAGEYDAVMMGEPLVVGPSGLTPGRGRERLRLRYTHRWHWLPRLNLVPRLPRLVTESVRRVWFKLFYPIQAIVLLNALPRREGWALGIRRRSVPWSSAAPLYKGSQWMALSRRAIEVCLSDDRTRRMRSYFATTLVPDEAYFHTLLGNDPGIRVRYEPVSWLSWKSDLSPHPSVIGDPELEEATRSVAPFARKFDETMTAGILDRVDKTLLFRTR